MTARSLIFICTLFFGYKTSAGVNLTNRYHEEVSGFGSMNEDLKKSEFIKELKKNYRILFIPGFYNILGNLGNFRGESKTDQVELYFKKQIEILEELDIDVRMVSTDAVKSVDDEQELDFLEKEIILTYDGNYSRLKDKIRTSYGIGSRGRPSFWRPKKPRRVVLVSHSRGGLDVLELLIRRPQLLSHIGGWVSLQAPYLGSPLADYINKNRGVVEEENIKRVLQILQNFKQTEKLAESAEEQAPLLGFIADVFSHMTTQSRLQYMKDNRAPILELEMNLRILNVATNQPKENSDKGEEILSSVLNRMIFDKVDAPNSLLAPTRNWILEKTGTENDGFVTLESQSALGDFVQLRGLDHFETVIALGDRLPFSHLLSKLPGPQFRTTGILASIRLVTE